MHIVQFRWWANVHCVIQVLESMCRNTMRTSWTPTTSWLSLTSALHTLLYVSLDTRYTLHSTHHVSKSTPPNFCPQLCQLLTDFYCAKCSEARYCQGKFPSVRLSDCLSVTLRYRGHIGWNSWKIISRLISLTFAFSAAQTPTSRIYSKRNTPNFSRNRNGVGKLSIFDILAA